MLQAMSDTPILEPIHKIGCPLHFHIYMYIYIYIYIYKIEGTEHSGVVHG